MDRRGRVTAAGSVRGLVVVLVVATVMIGGGTAAPAGAQEPTRPGGDEEVLVWRALERDLEIDRTELPALLAASDRAIELDKRLRVELGETFGGSWFDHRTRVFTVAVTTREAAARVTEAGAEPVLVQRSEQELVSITRELDALVGASPETFAGVHYWGVDDRTNQVVLTVGSGQAGEVAKLVAGYGDAARIEESELGHPEPAVDLPWLDGGIAYNGCSHGFNMRNNSGGRYVLTAGHCGDVGKDVVSFGHAVGPFIKSYFPTWDDAIIQVTNTGYWLQGSYIWLYSGYLAISSSHSDAPVGTVICKSGKTTGLTCGIITAKNQTVNYGPEYGVVYGLTRHSACLEPGDSGGPNIAVVGYRPEGVSSGYNYEVKGKCRAKTGGVSISWYFPAADSVPFYHAALGATLW